MRRSLLARMGALEAQLVLGMLLLLVMPLVEGAGVTSWNNCWYWAMQEQARIGGSVIATASRYGWWLHFVHLSADGVTYAEWTTRAKQARWSAPPIYKGYVLTWRVPCG